jgi:hypothetical protein
MQKIDITKENALKAYNQAAGNEKKILELLLGKENFQEITDLVKSYEDACKLDGQDPFLVLPFPSPLNEDQKVSNAQMKMTIINRVLNGEWKANYKDKNQPKYFAVFKYDVSVSAFRFWYTNYVFTVAITSSGARRVYKTPALAEYEATQFIDIINEIINN